MKSEYVRISAREQNETEQIKRDIEKSGSNDSRPELKEMLNEVSEGDTVCIHDIDRLSRDPKEAFSTANNLNEKGINLVSYKDKLNIIWGHH